MKREALKDQTEDSLLHVADVHVLPATKKEEGKPVQNFHYHNCFEIIIVQRGSVRVMVNYVPKDLVEGEVVMLRDNLPHELYACSADSRIVIVHIPRSMLLWNMDHIPELCREYAFVQDSRYGYLFRSPALCRRLLALARKIATDEGFLRISRVFKLLHELSVAPVDERLVENWDADGESQPAARHGENAVDRAFRYLRGHYAEPLSLEEIAAYANQNKTALCRAFKKATGYTLFQFANRLRVEQACELLRNTDESIARIAYHVGYNTFSHFSLRFRAVMGMSPGDYRKRA